MRKFKFIAALTLLFLIGFSTISTTTENVEVNKEKVFVKMVEQLAKLDNLKDYRDRTSLSKGAKPKLIVSDLKDNPILKGIYEGEDFIIAPYSEIVKSKVEIYLTTTNITIAKDSSNMTFELLADKYKLSLRGSIDLIPDDPTLNYETIYLKTKSEVSVGKWN